MWKLFSVCFDRMDVGARIKGSDDDGEDARWVQEGRWA